LSSSRGTKGGSGKKERPRQKETSCSGEKSPGKRSVRRAKGDLKKNNNTEREERDRQESGWKGSSLKQKRGIKSYKGGKNISIAKEKSWALPKCNTWG